MNARVSHSMLAAALAASVASAPLSAAQAQPPAISQPFTTQIFLQNPNPAAATTVINFYPELSGTFVLAHPVNLNANGSAQVAVGSLSLSSPWKGSAVVSADQPVVAAMIQVPPTGYGRIMFNAFTSADASSNIFLSTFLGRGNATNTASTFAVQNTESVPITITVNFIPTSGPTFNTSVVLPGFATKIFDGYDYTTTIGAGFPWAFDGSAAVTAVKVSDGTPALVVGSAEERRYDTGADSGRFRAYGFEAIPQSAGASTIYMPTALCQFNNTTTFYAIQNLSSSATTVVTVTYSGISTQQVNTALGPLAKWSVNPCPVAGAGYSGAAVIQSSGAPLAAVGKANQISGSQPRYSTAFLAQASGSRRLAVPYVRWNPTSPGTAFRSNIAIQNIGSTAVPTGQLSVYYYAQDGSLFRTCTTNTALVSGAKANSNVAGAFFPEFNCTPGLPSGVTTATLTFAGSAVIEGPSGAQLLAVIRNTTPAASTQIHTEDFNAIPLP